MSSLQLAVLAVPLVALNWGVGPSLFATLTGAALLIFVVEPPRFTWTLNETGLVEVFLSLLVGVTISIVASQIEKARRNAEELAISLTKERARLEAIIETMPDGLSIHDLQGKIIRLNRVGRQNTGPERVAYQAIADTQQTFDVRTVTGEPFPLEDFPVARALHGETVSSVELRFLNPTGQDVYALLSAAPLFDIEGKVEGAVLITHDITALHQSEHEIAEEKPVQVTLRVDENNARVSVQDEGNGLSPEEQTHVWERFYRVHHTEAPGHSASSNAGLGLGLYICKTIIEQHHGNVGVESTPNAGSTFWFTLPLAPSTEPPVQ